MRKVNVKCMECGNIVERNQEYSTDLRCGCNPMAMISFEETVERICEICGHREILYAGKAYAPYHTGMHFDCHFRVIDPGDNAVDGVKENPVEEAPAAMPVQKLNESEKTSSWEDMLLRLDKDIDDAKEDRAEDEDADNKVLNATRKELFGMLKEKKVSAVGMQNKTNEEIMARLVRDEALRTKLLLKAKDKKKKKAEKAAAKQAAPKLKRRKKR